MAQLDIRQRRLEATIAYVGTELAGKSTNVAWLLERPQAERLDAPDDVLSLAWRGAPSEFRDCEVTFRVVAPRGAPTKDTVQALLREADGVVLVVDADPDALEKHRESARALRHALGEARSASVPIVVQVNKKNITNAIPAASVMEALEARTWAHVSASAVVGDGVVETLECVIQRVLASMTAAHPQDAALEQDEITKVEGNPLLSALKQVLRETADRQLSALQSQQEIWLTHRGMEVVEDLVRRLTERMDQSHRESAAGMREKLDEMTELLTRLDRRVASVESRIAERVADESKPRRRGWFS